MSTRSLWLLPALALSACLAGCDVDVKDEGRLPEVDVKPGRAPDVDVHGPDVDVGTREETITVPDVDVDVDKQEKTITVPDVDVDVPDEEDNEPATPPAAPRTP